MKTINKHRYGTFIIITLALIFALSGVVSALNTTAPEKKPAANTNLPKVGSVENLKKLLQQSKHQHKESITFEVRNEKLQGTVSEAANTSAKVKSDDYSTTNTQVQGVDEADIVKTDGSYIYQVNQDSIKIIKAVPADKMQLVSSLKFFDPNFSPQDLYLDNNYLVVTGVSYHEDIKPLPDIYNEKKIWYPPYSSLKTTKAIVYDLNDKANAKLIREIEIQGYPVSSRKIGKSVYLISNQYINYYSDSDPIILPTYRDTNNSSTEFTRIDCEDMRYFPDNIYPSYIIIAGFNIDDRVNGANVNTYLGNGENIYASTKNLYIALTKHNYHTPILYDSNIFPRQNTRTTSIYKFALNNGTTEYKGKGKVPGNILNQFSMDEYKDTFRIATTTGDMWRDDNNTSKNNIYVLDKDLSIIGRLEGVAPGERIYSTRFMGNRAYMVTFRDVDPFFVIDLKNPEKPAILGKLKIPGYSDYLHPYDENHIIGFGKDTIQLKDYNGQPQAYYQGMKMAIFDVSDVSNPVEMSKIIIGDRGTDSELLRNHKALLFSKEKNLLAFPVKVMKITGDKYSNNDQAQIPEYGSFAFQGAYVYNLDLKNGFRLKGTITHLNQEDYQAAGDYWYDSPKNVERILYIGNNLYTLSQDMIKVHNLNNMQPIKTLELR